MENRRDIFDIEIKILNIFEFYGGIVRYKTQKIKFLWKIVKTPNNLFF